VIFVLIERSSRNPLLPLRIVLDRNRGGACLTSMLVGAGLFGAFLFLALFLQNVLGYTPLEAGFASLPTTVGVLISATVASNLLPRIGPKMLMLIGPVLTAGRPPSHRVQLEAQVDGHADAFTWAAGLILLAGVITAVFIKVGKEDLPSGEAAVDVG
jgi:hypothetical protein